MSYWDEDRPEWDPEELDFAAAWRRHLEAAIRGLKPQFGAMVAYRRKLLAQQIHA